MEKGMSSIPAKYWEGMGCRPAPIPEFQFCKTRRFRADYAWPKEKVLVEIEGGVWTRGRHTRGEGYISDMEKYNLAQAFGYVVLRYTPSAINFGEIKCVLDSRRNLNPT